MNPNKNSSIFEELTAAYNKLAVSDCLVSKARDFKNPTFDRSVDGDDEEFIQVPTTLYVVRYPMGSTYKFALIEGERALIDFADVQFRAWGPDRKD